MKLLFSCKLCDMSWKLDFSHFFFSRADSSRSRSKFKKTARSFLGSSFSFHLSYQTLLYVLPLLRRRFSKTNTVKIEKLHQNFSFLKIAKNLLLRPKTAMCLFDGECWCPHFGESFVRLSFLVFEKLRYEVLTSKGDHSRTNWNSKFNSFA